jgi:thymidylate kinase
MKIITISGLDGSGKSTQIELLKNHLESQGKKVFYFHAIQQGFAKKIIDFRNKYCLICKLSGKCRVKRDPAERDKKQESITKANWLQIQLRKLFLKIDICRFKRLRNKLCNLGYDYILSDRYFYDSLVNIEYLELQRDTRAKLSDIRELRSGIKTDLSIYLQTSPETIMSRDRVPDQGLEYLKKKKKLYDRKISEWNMKVVDGNQEKEKILKDLVSFLNL